MMSILLKYYVTFSAIITVVFSANLTNSNNTAHMEGFIVGGVETTSKNFPHAAYLHIVAVDEGNYLCGSSIVNQRVVITAAHCLEIDNLDIHVYIGHEDIHKARSVRRVNKLLVHEHYDPEEVINDIALLFTSENIKFSQTIKRVIISRTYPSGYIDASVAGWGMINDYTHEVAIKLKAAKQKMQAIDNCVTHFTAGMMCAGDLHSDKNRPSKGDSGSGLITSNFQLIGLVSFRIDDRPGLVIYTNVTHYLNWINKGVHKLTCLLGSDTEWHFAHRGLPQARPRRSIAHARILKQHPLVHTAVQQTGFKRVKRGFRPLRLPEPAPAAEPRDPYFPLQWYLKNTGQNGGKPKLDLNVEAAWAQGYTGVNVTTAIMDDGVDYMHPDLKYNYNAEASYDFSSNDPFPYPRYTDDWFNSHGTRCAGEVAAARDNGVCGVGVAYHSKVAGIRMLDQPYMTDLIEANSMGHEPHKIHIYSASWGPTDDGRTVDGPRNATMRAIVRGVNEGRNGLGNIYVWASGDGGEDDDCNCDGYAASMWTVSINSAINDGQNAHYDESCSSTLASTFSNGARDPSTGVATTDLYGKCTATHSGTSAAAPEAAGVFALALHANPKLTWRDIQHLTVLTSKRNSLYDAKGRFHWTMNGVGLEFNHLFGFGVLDAGAMTALAANWRSVPPRYHCEAGSVNTHTEIPSDGSITLKIDTKACEGSPSEVRYLEHVQAVVSANSTRRGDLEFFLTSPMGTRSMILSRRANDDDSRDGFTKWPFMTTHTWGEYPQGTWSLEARFNGGSGPSSASGWVRGWSLVLHGTRSAPYAQLQPQDPHSKLAVVKKAHEDNAFAK